jgi:hypothetical protein
MDSSNKRVSWKKIPTFLAVLVIIAGVAGGVTYINDKNTIPVSARENATPRDVRVSNIESDSISVSWATSAKTKGFLVWGDNESTKNVIVEDATKPKYNHLVNLTSLMPDTTYYFKIYSENILFENNSIPWQSRTAYKTPDTVKPFIISGIVKDKYGNPINNALIYITAGGGSLLTSLTTRNGSFVADISRAKNQSLENFVKIDNENTLVEIVVQGNPQDTASVQVYPKDAQPIHPIVMGLSLNFKTPQEESDYVPNSNIQVRD